MKFIIEENETTDINCPFSVVFVDKDNIEHVLVSRE